MQPARLNRTTSHLVPHLGGVVASIGAFSHVGVYTLARVVTMAHQRTLQSFMVHPNSGEVFVKRDMVRQF